jgi:hypothetical protein
MCVASFYLDVVYVCNGFQLFLVVLQVYQMHISSVSSVFFCILQVLRLDILKVDQVLHMGCTWEEGGGASSPCAGDIWATGALHGRA